MKPVIELKYTCNDKAKYPLEFATDGSAAVDLRVLLKNEGYVGYVTKEGSLFHTGVSIDLMDSNYGMLILPRSSMGKRGIMLANTVGLIDSDYQGEIMLNLFSRTGEDILIEHGERVAQLLFIPILKPTLKEVDEFSRSTQRGAGGFGSTGTK